MDDAALIEELGGPAKVAELLGYDKSTGGVQRVHNWIARGIPARIKLQRPDLFLPEMVKTKKPARAQAASRREGSSNNREGH